MGRRHSGNPVELFARMIESRGDASDGARVEEEGTAGRLAAESNRESPRNGSHIVIGYNAGFSMQLRSR